MGPGKSTHGRPRVPAVGIVVRVTSEPSRIAAECLARAYAVAVPVVRRVPPPLFLESDGARQWRPARREAGTPAGARRQEGGMAR